ncbi:MAG TPA: phosphatase PAP2 family protein [Anaerolineaceae bacterium]|nr:phosphatase PAP2 family protein [Anaerolineaceae bacterium]
MGLAMLQKIMDFDHKISGKIRIQPEQKFLWRLAAFLAHTGDSWYWLGALFLLWLLASGEWHYKTAFLAIGIAVQIVIIFAIKFTVRRSRPEGQWGAFYRNTDPHSFPSGHAARAGLLLAMAVGLGPAWFALVITVWAPIMSLARVVMGVHYLVDVVAGLLIGILIGWLVLLLEPFWLQLVPFVF